MEIRNRKLRNKLNKMNNNIPLKSFFSKYVLIPKKEIAAWKVYVIITFVTGFAAVIIVSFYNDWITESQASQSFSETTLFTYTNQKNHQANKDYSLKILLDTGGKNIVAAQVIATYDPTMIQVMDIDNASSDFNFEVFKNVDNQKGEIFLALAKPTPGVNSHEVKVASVIIKPLRDFAGSGIKLKFNSLSAVSDSAAILDDGKGTNVLRKTAEIFESSGSTEGGFKILSLVSLSDDITRIVWNYDSVNLDNQIVVERKRKKDKEFREIASLSGNDFYYVDHTALKGDHFYRVCIVNPDGSKVCTEPVKVKAQKKKKIFVPRLTVALMEEGKRVRVSWSPQYTSDFGIFIQKKSSLWKGYRDVGYVSGTENQWEDSDITPGQSLSYRIKVAAHKKKTTISKSVRIKVK